MIFLLATISEALIIGTCVFTVCLGLIYMFFFRGKLHDAGKLLSKQLSKPMSMSDADYELITERVMQIEGKYKTILFAATSITCLPITIPVNVGVCLSQAGKRCLLIDIDLQRNAIAKAFEIDEHAAGELDRPLAYRTSFENLHLWPAHNFSHKSVIDLTRVIEEEKSEFDFIIISATNLDQTADQRQVISASDCSFIFSHNATNATRLSSLMKAGRCSVIGNIKISTT